MDKIIWITSPQPFAHLDDKRSDVLLFQHDRVVPGTVEKLEFIVVDILDLNDDETMAVRLVLPPQHRPLSVAVFIDFNFGLFFKHVL